MTVSTFGRVLVGLGLVIVILLILVLMGRI